MIWLRNAGSARTDEHQAALPLIATTRTDDAFNDAYTILVQWHMPWHFFCRAAWAAISHNQLICTFNVEKFFTG